MALQDVVWIIALLGMGLVALGFIHVIIQAGKPVDARGTQTAAATSRRWQGRMFWLLLAGFIIGSWATLHRYPVPPQAGSLPADQVVDVLGRMWSWQITPASVRAGSLVEFRVTSGDVNHGFAIYAPDGRIVTQTQAMPGFTNRLLHRFAQPGTYTVQCLEYCGLGHAPMRASFQVVAEQEH
ncbi:cytochrome oxidase [Dokdonella sp.]|uniref:cytochrome oxidase n=1 Tax=Dokdonella sp. TaxID=2291710 RepID=UPI0031C0A08B|nr:cytochrome oxidase [Dokdonella sp.]